MVYLQCFKNIKEKLNELYIDSEEEFENPYNDNLENHIYLIYLLGYCLSYNCSLTTESSIEEAKSYIIELIKICDKVILK